MCTAGAPSAADSAIGYFASGGGRCGLRQFDVRLDAIDIVSARKRHVSEAADPSAPPTVDDRPAGVQHVAGVTDGSAAQYRRGGGPRFGALDLGGGRRAAPPRSGRTALRGPAFDRR
jgi:hypothetical protein